MFSNYANSDSFNPLTLAQICLPEILDSSLAMKEREEIFKL
jgi:hypothetical protein